jgi:hypothetical protein
MNPNLLFEIKNFYKFSPKYINYKDEHNCRINQDLLYSINPAINTFSYQIKINNLDKCIYNPYTLDYAVENPNYCKNPSYYALLNENLSIIYNYIISKEFYDKVIKYKNQYPECYPLWEMWLNINPYSEDLLLSDINMLWLDVLSLNPKCFKIFEKYKETKYYDSDSDYLNDDVLSVNPCITSYNYFAIKERNQDINEELIKELYSPERISKYLINNESIDEYLN